MKPNNKTVIRALCIAEYCKELVEVVGEQEY